DRRAVPGGERGRAKQRHLVLRHSRSSLSAKAFLLGRRSGSDLLALRLAFALATLPGEHNVRPGWLFLDEPLSSFDRGRTQALVDLITRGLIRKQFAQILLISHSDSVAPGQFDHHLRMEDGRVVGDDLLTSLAA